VCVCMYLHCFTTFNKNYKRNIQNIEVIVAVHENCIIGQISGQRNTEP